jgi:acylphosphatase
MVCYRYLISGHVQGVFYRTSAQHQASALGLCGWVRNLVDGRVELLACGDQVVLDELEKWLKIGPEYAKVSNIKVVTESPKVLPLNFEVRPTSSL